MKFKLRIRTLIWKAPNSLKTKCKLKGKRDAKLSYDPGQTMVCQPKKYIEELHEKYIRLFKDNPHKDLKTLI